MKKDARDLPLPKLTESAQPRDELFLTQDLHRESSVRGHSSGFEAVFLANWTRVYALLMRIVGDVDQAEDLAMETFWKLYRHPPREQINIYGWLCRVATNLGLNALRSRNRRAKYEALVGSSNLENKAENNPHEELEQTELRRQVRSVLGIMKPRSAQLLLLRHSGLSYAELAEVLKIRPSSIGKMLARAEQEFERLYRRSYPDDVP